MTDRSLLAGFRVGHWTDGDALTGCTVVLPPSGNVASCEIRGSSPGSRELEMLHPDRRLTEVHAVLLTGGSAFGLAAADGVVAWLEERGIGYDALVARVPIVPAAVVFDLGSGRADVRPGPREGRAACEDAREDAIPTGNVGAGTGATVGKWAGREFAARGGLGIGHARTDGATVAALAVVNAVGDVLAEDGSVVAGTTASQPRYRPPPGAMAQVPSDTVLALVVAEATLDKREVRWLAARGADGITTAVRPAHTLYDGDVVFAVCGPPRGGAAQAPLEILGPLATQAVSAAIRNAVAR